MPWGSASAMRFAIFGGVALLVIAVLLSSARVATAPDRAGHVAAVKAYNTASEVGAVFAQDPSAVNAIANHGSVTGTTIGQDGLNNSVAVGVTTTVTNGAYVVTATAPGGKQFSSRTALRAAAAPNGTSGLAK